MILFHRPAPCAGTQTHPVATDPATLGTTSAIQGLAGTQRIQGGLPLVTQKAWRAVAAAFPNVDGLGAWGDRAHMARKSCHNSGLALDVMTKDRATHKQIVQWALANRDALKITLIISQRFKRSARTKWIAVPYLGASPHTDHVHLSIDCTG